MKLDLKSTRTNQLFNRKEIEFIIEEKSTPSKSSVRIEIAVALKVEPNQIYIRSLETKTGTRQTIGVAHVYDDPELALKVEPKHIVERNKIEVQVESKEE